MLFNMIHYLHLFVKIFLFKLRGFADGVIIDSKIVKMIEDNLDDKEKMKSEVKDFISTVKAAL